MKVTMLSINNDNAGFVFVFVVVDGNDDGDDYGDDNDERPLYLVTSQEI